jgi:hypothetical protein
MAGRVGAVTAIMNARGAGCSFRMSRNERRRERAYAQDKRDADRIHRRIAGPFDSRPRLVKRFSIQPASRRGWTWMLIGGETRWPVCSTGSPHRNGIPNGNRTLL